MMKRYLLICLLLLSALSIHAQALVATQLKCDYQRDPTGIAAAQPHLSWQLQSTDQNVLQSGYRILVSDALSSLQKDNGNIWDSHKVNLQTSIQVPYQGKPLIATKKYFWKVMVWDNHGHVSGWSKIAQWQMGLLTTADWKGANWIGYQNMPDSLRIVPELSVPGKKKRSPGTDILPMLRKSIQISKPVKSATMFISGLGNFELSLNGKKVGDHLLDGGWVDYQKQAQYVSFDVGNSLKMGKNAIGVMLGNGFYFTPTGRYRKLTVAYGYPKMICRLLIEFKDGTVQNVISNTLWKAAPSPVTFSSIYGGEDYDATKEEISWNMPGYNDSKWNNAVVVSGPKVLNPQMTSPVKVFEVFTPKKTTQLKPDEWVYDMGQNASGIPQIVVSGNRGDTVTITPSELLDENSAVTQKNTGKSHYYKYILKGSGQEVWQPQFTYYGFRYLQVNLSVPHGNTSKELPRLFSIKSLHTRNATDRVGDFTCSNDLFNRTNRLIDWSIQNNMVSTLTDCPHREKLGWLEQDHLVGNSLQYNYDIASLGRKIVGDMKDAQTADGLIPEIAPEYTVFGDGFRDSPEWGSTSILLPWYMYQWYGDKQVLSDSYTMMQRYVAYLQKKSNNYILTQGLGDWYDLGPNRPGVSQLTPQGVTATAYFYYDLCTLSDISKLLNKTADAANYTKLAAEVKKAFNEKFFNKTDKQYATGSQTANAIAVYMKLVEPEYKAAVIENIVKDLRGRNNSLTAGDIGYRYLLKVLDAEGRSDVIFDMNNRTDVPGYGYQLNKGATALTESWQALPSVSNDHLMLGHLMEWFYEGAGGIRQAADAVAYNKIEIRPQPVGDLTSAKATYHSVYGMIASEWKKQEKQFELIATIPPNTVATINLPADSESVVTVNGKPLLNKKTAAGFIITAVGSGVYHFKATKN